MIDRYTEIVSNSPVSRDTWIMGLRSPELAAVTKPGQFVMIKVRPGIDPLLRRPFSVCGVEGERFMVLYRVVGKGTEIMTTIRPGESLPVLGPLGNDFLEPGEDILPVLVGGGIGVAPLLFLAQSLETRKLEFMMGFRTAREIIRPGHLLAPTHTLSLSTDDGTEGHPGFVTDLLPPLLERHRGFALSLFACGPKPMLRKVAEVAMLHGIPCQVSLESTMACGFGVCQGCVVKASAELSRSYNYVCQDGPVFNVNSIDWSQF
jgi:dihydroorotate dehydrogenase electron transfer subunit